MIEAIQGNATEATRAIESITSVVTDIHGHQQTIASAVEEQNATTVEVTRSLAEAASSGDLIADEMSSLSGIANDLAQIVQRFRLSSSERGGGSAPSDAVTADHDGAEQAPGSRSAHNPVLSGV
ncbi:hypothetical protein BH23ACT10_BH23ACT10_32800 [soil metagenome]